MKHYVAIDLGAESGRAIQATIADGKLTLEELHRFPNTPVRLPTGLYWDMFNLWHEIQQGLAVAGRERKVAVDGIGVDTWGVDLALLAADGSLADNPRHYRDSRNAPAFDKLLETVSRSEIYSHSGIQFMPFNTLVQLYAMKQAGAPALEIARKLILVPDLLNYWLTGVAKAELTIASTTQFYNPVKKRWATELLEKLDLPVDLLPEIVQPGVKLGPIRAEVAETTGLDPATPVFATASHDTAAAVAAVPAEGADWCYISSGTWSLMGVELDEPIVTEKATQLNLTNEVGAEGRIRLLKNIAGMWPLQECRRYWAANGREYDYGELALMAARATPFTAVINPDEFLAPGRMPERIAEACRSTGQKVPEEPGEMARTILEGLAMRYRQVLESIEELIGRKIGVIHIVGGGSRNEVLNQLAADCTSRTVVAGPTEATGAGNVLVQAMGSGLLKDLAAARQMVRASFPVKVFEPSSNEGWDAAYELFHKISNR